MASGSNLFHLSDELMISMSSLLATMDSINQAMNRTNQTLDLMIQNQSGSFRKTEVKQGCYSANVLNVEEIKREYYARKVAIKVEEEEVAKAELAKVTKVEDKKAKTVEMSSSELPKSPSSTSVQKLKMLHSKEEEIEETSSTELVLTSRVKGTYFDSICTSLCDTSLCCANCLPSNLSKQVSFKVILQAFGIKDVLITKPQQYLAFEPHTEVYPKLCLSLLISSSRLLLYEFRVTLPIYITVPSISEVPHHDFVFGDRNFFHTLELPYPFTKFCHQCSLQVSYCRLHDREPWSPCCQIYWFNVPNESSFHLDNWALCSSIPFFSSFTSLHCPCSFRHYLLLMHLCWFSDCRGRVRGRVFLGKELSSFDFVVLDSRTNPLKEGGDDVIMDSTTTTTPEEVVTREHGGPTRDEPEPNSTTSTLEDQQMNSPAWRKDPLIGLGGPMTRSRTKKMKETLLSLIRSIQEESKPRVEGEPKMVTLLKVIST